MKTEKQIIELLKNGWVILCDYPLKKNEPFLIREDDEDAEKTYCISKKTIKKLLENEIIRDTSSNSLVIEYRYNIYTVSGQ